MNNMKLEMEKRTASIEAVLKKYMPKEAGYEKTVTEAMNYSILAGGKRLRPMIMEETYHLFGGRTSVIEPFMAAIEMIHTYSLVHDDLPAMDNDEYRRGKKTTHAVYGEAMGILAGDALLNYAFETAAKAFDWENEIKRTGQAMGLLAQKAGIHGMLGGQVADVEAEKKAEKMTMEKLLFIHEKKTAALLEASFMIGGILAGADLSQQKILEQIGSKVGIAFQIQDDILDITSSFEELGKPIGSDEKNQKETYVTLVGIEQSRLDVKKLSDEAQDLLQQLPGEKEFLQQLIGLLVDRRS